MVSEFQVILLGIISVIIVARIAKLLTGSLVAELIITGAFVGIIESYHFMLQPNLTIITLPHLPAATQIFIAAFAITRAALLVLEVIPFTQPFVVLLTG